jgi:hypothetical protein
MQGEETIAATSGGQQHMFTLDWGKRRWSSDVEYEMADFPFVAEIRGKRYELYGDGRFDGTFDEEELPFSP